jgi:hypothetical protein
MTASASREPEPDSGEVFARLVGELDELGFEPTRPVEHPHDTVYTTTYTATDSGVAVTVVADASEPHVCVSARRGTGPAWSMHWTVAAPTRGPTDHPVRRRERGPCRRARSGRGGARHSTAEHGARRSHATFPLGRLRRRSRHAGAPDNGRKKGVVGRPPPLNRVAHTRLGDPCAAGPSPSTDGLPVARR